MAQDNFSRQVQGTALTLASAKTKNFLAYDASASVLTLSDRPGHWRRSLTPPSVSQTDYTGFVDGGGTSWILEPDKGRIDIRSLGVTQGQNIATILPIAAEYANSVASAPFAAVTIVIPPGIWYLDTPVEIVDQSVSIYAVGARIIKRHDIDTAFSVRGSWQTTAVTSGATLGSTSLTLASSANIFARTLLRIVSDDEIVGSYSAGKNSSDPTAMCRRGEVNSVFAAPLGNTITLATPLIDTYTTNVRVGIYRDISVVVEGGLWEGEEGHDNVWSRGLFKVQGAVPMVSFKDLILRRCYGSSGIKLYGLYQPRLHGITFYGFSIDAGHSFYDYGIEDGNCTGLVATNIIGMGTLRHIYTTTAPQVQAGYSELGFYGASRGMCVGPGTAVGNFQAALDTHHGSEDGLFHNWVIMGDGGTGSGVGLRGRRHTAQGIKVRGARYGFYIFTERGKIDTPALVAANGTRDCTIINCDASDCSMSSFKMDDALNIKIVNGRFSNKTFRAFTMHARTDAVNSLVLEGSIEIVNGNGYDTGFSDTSSLEAKSSHIFEIYGSSATVENRGSLLFNAVNGNTNNFSSSLNLIYSNAPYTRWSGSGKIEVISPTATGTISLFGFNAAATDKLVSDNEITLPTNIRTGLGSSQSRIKVRGRNQAVTSKATVNAGEVFITNTTPRDVYFVDPLTAQQLARLPIEDPTDGDIVRIIRASTCTGAYNLVVRQGTGTPTTVYSITTPGNTAVFQYSAVLASWKMITVSTAG